MIVLFLELESRGLWNALTFRKAYYRSAYLVLSPIMYWKAIFMMRWVRALLPGQKGRFPPRPPRKNRLNPPPPPPSEQKHINCSECYWNSFLQIYVKLNCGKTEYNSGTKDFDEIEHGINVLVCFIRKFWWPLLWNWSSKRRQRHWSEGLTHIFVPVKEMYPLPYVAWQICAINLSVLE